MLRWDKATCRNRASTPGAQNADALRVTIYAQETHPATRSSLPQTTPSLAQAARGQGVKYADFSQWVRQINISAPAREINEPGHCVPARGTDASTGQWQTTIDWQSAH